jgi:formyl-CoA transferase
MRLGEVGNAAAAGFGKPLDGVRILALEQMQALPFATQLMARLGAEVVKVESPKGGDSGRTGLPAFTDAHGQQVGATFSRNNLNKRSITVDLKSPRGRELVLALAPRFDVFAQNFKAGAMSRLGLGYDDVAAVHPGCVYVSISGFGTSAPSPYDGWPAYAAIVEAMCGLYDFTFADTQPPVPSPMGGLGDIGTALFAVIGVLAALRHREATGLGQHVDVAMLDAMVSMGDVVPNLWSLGVDRGGARSNIILDSFRACDGWFVVQVVREHQFERLAGLVGHPEWVGDSRFATRHGWAANLEAVIRPALEKWASAMTRVDACAALSDAGIAAGPCFQPAEVVRDPHVSAHDMLVEHPRADGVDQPVLIPGNPIKPSRVAQGPETPLPGLGEHTDEVLSSELGLSAGELASLHADGVV